MKLSDINEFVTLDLIRTSLTNPDCYVVKYWSLVTGTVSEALLTLNSSVNFLMYPAISKDFRTVLKQYIKLKVHFVSQTWHYWTCQDEQPVLGQNHSEFSSPESCRTDMPLCSTATTAEHISILTTKQPVSAQSPCMEIPSSEIDKVDKAKKDLLVRFGSYKQFKKTRDPGHFIRPTSRNGFIKSHSNDSLGYQMKKGISLAKIANHSTEDILIDCEVRVHGENTIVTKWLKPHRRLSLDALPKLNYSNKQ